MTQDKLTEILAAHAAWLADNTKGERADLTGADLAGVDLTGFNLAKADLRWADLTGANLCWADLTGANLCWANLCWANLSGANLCGADLSEADLGWADLHKSDLTWANLCGANLFWADLFEADLSGANLCGANLTGVRDVIALGQPNGWFAFAFRREGTIWVRVGCRTKTITEGRAYWADKPHRREVLAALDYAEAIAKLRRWLV